jgi:hypothetical protein
MKKALIVLLIAVLFFGLAGCDGGWSHNDPTPTPRMVCVQTGSGGVRCFDVPDYPKLNASP